MNLRSVLADSTLFSRLEPEALDALAANAQAVELAGGQSLFPQGAPSDCIYVVASGRLRAVLANGQIAGDIARLEPIGEIGVLSGEPRVAAVHAVRDSMLVRIAREHLFAVTDRHPAALMEMTRVIIHRLRQNQRVQRLEAARSVRALAVLPAIGDVDAGAVAAGLRDALAANGSVRLVDSVLMDAELGAGSALTGNEGVANARVVEFLNRVEAQHRQLIYLAGSDPDAWASRCMRQADRILVVASNRSPPLASAMVHELRSGGVRAPIDLVLVRPEGESAGNVIGWREQVNAQAHYFVRPGSARDHAALARQLTGRGIGLVLGGGGARGFAHIGLLRALRELQIPIDLAGGSSMGAFLAALVACGFDDHELSHFARETFVARNFLNDYLFPTIALIRGRKFVRRLHEIFEDRRVETLRMPYFCVSTNLTRGAAMVHDRGPLYMWIAASMSVPGVAPPVAYRGELLADGAVINSLPTDVMQGLERGPIIASDVSTEGGVSAPGIEGPDPEGLFKWKGEGERPGLFSIVFRTATLTSESGVAQRAARADAYLRMPVSGIGLFDWKKMDDIVERGYRFAMERLAPLKDQLLRS